MGKVAFLFPGQGAQKVGMGKALYDEEPAAKAVFDQVDEALSEHFSKTIFEGPAEALTLTKNTQPAILAMSVAVLEVLKARGVPAPDFACGHSLGEYSALVCAGAMPLSDAARAVRARGTFMQEAVPEGEGAMAAVMGLGPDDIRKVLAEVSDPDNNAYVGVANENGPAQTVIAGHAAGVDKAGAALKAAGAKRVVPLPVSAPFHSALMEPVVARLKETLAGVRVREMALPVVANFTAEANQEKSKIVDLLLSQVTGTVRFTECADKLVALGAETFVEVGPGKTLVGIMRRMHKDKTYLNAEDPASVAAVVEALGG